MPHKTPTFLPRREPSFPVDCRFFTFDQSIATSAFNITDFYSLANDFIVSPPNHVRPQYKELSRVDVGGVANFRSLQPANHRLVYRPVSCASLASLSLSLGILSALWHCGLQLAGAAHHGICHLANVKPSLLGGKHCAATRAGVN